jgi:hypothetical protein
MSESLRAALPMVMLIGGIALIVFAAYLHYAALPEEQTMKHVATQAVIAVVGLALILLGAGSFR